MLRALAGHHAHRNLLFAEDDRGPVAASGPERGEACDLAALGYQGSVEEVAERVWAGVGGVDGVGQWLAAHEGRSQLLRDLGIIACADFGLRPVSPLQVLASAAAFRSWQHKS